MSEEESAVQNVNAVIIETIRLRQISDALPCDDAWDIGKTAEFMFVLLYHFLMFCIDLLLLRAIGKQQRTSVWFFLNLAEQGILAAIILGAFLTWLNANLIVHGLVWHGGFYLLGSALLIRRQAMNGKHPTALPLAIFLLTLVYLGLAVDVLLIEPTSLTVKRCTITTPKITKPMKIVFIADIQTDRIGWYERKTLELVKKENADLILLGGDYLQASSKEQESQLIAEFNALLKKMDLNVPYGIYAIQGNQESYTRYDWTQSFKETNIIPIKQTKSLNIGEIRLTLLGMYNSFTNRTFFDKNPENRFRIIAGHAPLFALADQQADLLLAGHTHGGQVQIPGFGPLITMSKGLPREWASGITKLPNGSTLIVSNGTGLERGSAPRVRFWCRPDFWVIELVPK